MANVFDLMAVLKLDSSAFQKGLTAAGKLAKTGMTAVGAAVGVATAAVTAFGKASIDTGKEFDSSMSQIAATLGFTGEAIEDNLLVNGERAGEAFDALREKALEMGSKTMYTAKQSAEGLNILSMAGFKSYESVAMIEDVLNLAAAGSMELSQAAGYVSGSLKGFNNETKMAKDYADLMAKGATLANTSVSQLGEALSGAAATASGYRQSSDSVTLSLLRLANQNVVGSAAATAMNRAMADLYTPTDQAAKALKELGVAAYESDGTARDFNTVVDELNASMSEMTDEQKNAYKATIFTAQGLSAFNKMTAASTDDIQKWKEGIADATGSAAEQYATMTDNLEGDLTSLGSAMDGLKIAVSDQLTPSFREFVKFGTSGVQQITQAFRADGLNGAMDALGSVLGDGIGIVMGKTPEFLQAGTRLLGALGQGIASNIPNVLSQMGDFAFTMLAQINDKAPEMISKGAEMIGNLITGFAAGIPKWSSYLTTVVITIGNALVKNAPKLIASAGTLVQSLFQGFMQNAPRLLQAGAQMIKNIGEGIGQNLPEVIQRGLTMVQEFASMLAENAPALIDAGISFISNLVMGIVNSIPTLIEQVPTIVTTFANIINDNAPHVLMAGVNLLLNVGKGLIQAIPTLVANIPKIIGAIVAAWSAFNWLQLGKQAITFMKNGVMSMLGAIKTAGTNISTGITNILQQLPAKLLNIGKNGIAGLQGAFQAGVNTIRSAAGYIVSGVISTFMTLPTRMVNIGANIISGLWNGISNKAGWVVNMIKGLGSSIINAAKSVFGVHSPSRVFQEIGNFIVEGFEIGISDMASVTDDLFESMKAPKDLLSADPFKVSGGIARYEITEKDERSNDILDDLKETIDELRKEMKKPKDVYIDGRKAGRAY